jgi:hypothetical protein
MPDNEAHLLAATTLTPWNKGKLIGAKPPLRSKHVWAIRTRLMIEGRTRDLAMFNLAIDSKLRGCDVVALKVEDIAPNGYAIDRAAIRQRKTGRPVKFELTDQTRQAAEVPKVRRLNRIVEFSYPVDSKHHPLVQLSDLIIYLTRKFLEYENGYRQAWPPEARNFFASCYDKIIERALWKTLIEMKGQEEVDAYKLLTTCRSTHRQVWRKHYQLPQG